MTFAPSTHQLEWMATAMLPKMDDPQTWEGPAPQCTGQAHDWSMVHNKDVSWSDRIGSGTTTYRVAIVCSHCDAVLGFG